MKYLDMVLTETLRKWPPAPWLDRECNTIYNLGKPYANAKKDYIVEPKEIIFIPIWAIHRDPKYYDNPLKFDPERFSDENIHKIKPFTYMPLGVGPRNCIGSRFALIEAKLLICDLLRKFEVSPAPQTLVPPEADPSVFSLRMKGGHWLRFKIRS